MTVPYTFATGAATRPAAQIDANFAAVMPLTAGVSFPLTGTLYSDNITSTEDATIAQTYGFTSILTALDFDVAAISAGLPEQTATFRMTSNVGGATAATYKAAFGAETIASSASSPVWAGTFALTTNTGYALTKSQISLEVDHNNNTGFDAPDADVGLLGVVPIGAFYITGAGANQINFGLGISGNAQIRNGVVFFTGGPIYTSITDYSQSQIGAHDELTTIASSSSRAGLNLPHGAAPSAPNNGDMWTTSSGLFVRINGSTIGPLS